MIKLGVNKKALAPVLLSLIINFFVMENAISDDKSNPSNTKGETAMSDNTDHLNIPFNTIQGEASSLRQFADRVILIVNVASECGFTPQYEGLEALYRKYKDEGLVIIGFPANNFGKQEPGSDAEILEFCRKNFDVTFPMMAKISVLGDDIHPLYAWLTVNSGFPGDLNWNFNKFLLNRQGNVVERFGPRTEPFDEKLVSMIEELLGLKD